MEKIHQKCLEDELKQWKIQFQTEHMIPLTYKGIDIQTNLKCELLIENAIIVELKSVDFINPIFEAPLLSNMKLLQIPQGLIINFNVKN